jgi:GxxExxY protein
MTENEIAKQIVDAAYAVHTRLGPGLLESVYEAVLTYEIELRGLRVDRQVAIGIQYEKLSVPEAFRADLVVENKVIVELKSVEAVAPVHKKQLLTYLRLADRRLGLLINFGAETIREGIHRVANRMPDPT